MQVKTCKMYHEQNPIHTWGAGNKAYIADAGTKGVCNIKRRLDTYLDLYMSNYELTGYNIFVNQSSRT